MRKIEQWMLDTIKAQKAYFDKNSFASFFLDVTKDNTRVTTGKREDGKIVTTVYLHGNLIAQSDAATGWRFKMCGWNTPTTRSRISCIAIAAGGYGVNNRSGIPYSGRKEVPEDDWFTAEPR